MKWNPLNTKVGVALGGGAAKGIAHIGVLKALKDKEIPISCISGTSAGALVAAYFAFGVPIEKINETGKNLNFRKIMSFTFKRLGLMDTEALKSMIINDLGDVRIEEATIPLAITATEIHTGRKLVFTKGPVADLVCASMAIPGLFVPVEVGHHMLVDGGIVENVPISPLESMGAGIIVAVDLNGVATYPKPDNSLDVVVNAIDIGIDLRTREQLQAADVVISLDLSQYNRFDNTDNNHALYLEGLNGAQKPLNRLSWYRRINSLRYLVKVVRELIPLKIPHLFSRLWVRWHFYKSRWNKK